MAICATTILQEEVDDDYRGRVFSFYDMMFNVAYVAGPRSSRPFMPVTGKSPALVGAGGRRVRDRGGGYWLPAPSAGAERG